MKINNPMFNEECKERMKKHKMYNVCQNQFNILINEFGLKNLDEWDNFKKVFKLKYETPFISYKTFKKWYKDENKKN